MYLLDAGLADVAALAEGRQLAGRRLEHAEQVALGILADLHALPGGPYRSLHEHDVADEHADLLEVVALAAVGLVVQGLVAVRALGMRGRRDRCAGDRDREDQPFHCLAPCAWAASNVPRTFEWNLTTRLMLS